MAVNMNGAGNWMFFMDGSVGMGGVKLQWRFLVAFNICIEKG
jgi:hypothetical protein